MWKASRWAVRLPMPGSLASSVTSRWIGGAFTAGSRRAPPEAGQAHRAEVQAAGEAAHLLLGQRLGRADRLVGRGEHEVLQQLDVLGIDRGGIDHDVLDLQIAGHLDLHHAAAGGRLDRLVLELLLGGHHVGLHLLDLLEHLLHVRLGHQWASASSSWVSSSASNASLKRAITSSSVSGGGSSAIASSSRSS